MVAFASSGFFWALALSLSSERLDGRIAMVWAAFSVSRRVCVANEEVLSDVVIVGWVIEEECLVGYIDVY